MGMETKSAWTGTISDPRQAPTAKSANSSKTKDINTATDTVTNRCTIQEAFLAS